MIFRVLNMIDPGPPVSDVYRLQADLCRALSHPVRLSILEVLRDGEQCVCHMEATLGLRQASISQQLMILREAGVVDFRRQGPNIYYRVVMAEIFPVLDAINAATGGSRTRIAHVHANAACPCPKCNAVKNLGLDQLAVRG